MDRKSCVDFLTQQMKVNGEFLETLSDEVIEDMYNKGVPIAQKYDLQKELMSINAQKSEIEKNISELEVPNGSKIINR